MRELLVAEVLDDLDVAPRTRRDAASPAPSRMCSGRKPARSESAPTPTTGAGMTFIAGEPMKLATNMFAGRV